MPQDRLTMAAEPLRVLLIQSWTIPGSEIRQALRAGGFEPYVYRVDFESALEAALPRNNHDVVIVDSASAELPRRLVERLMRDHGVEVPLVDFTQGCTLADDVRSALSALRN